MSKTVYHFFNSAQWHHSVPFIKDFHGAHEGKQSFIVVGAGERSKYLKLLEQGVDIRFSGKWALIFLLFKLCFGRENVLVLHGFNYQFLIFFRFSPIKRAATKWVCWGAGLVEKNGFLGRVENRAKAWLYSGVSNINVLMAPDSIFLLKNGVEKNLISTIPYRRLTEPVVPLLNRPPGEVVLIGNSSARRNNHLELLEKLHSCSEQISEVVIFLGYGGASEEYLAEIESLGERRFGKRLSLFKKMMSLEEYATVMQRVSIVIIPGATQTGLGAIYAGVENCATIYLDSDGRNAQWLSDLGLKYKAIAEIAAGAEISIEESARRKNRDIYEKQFGQEKISADWGRFIGLKVRKDI